MKKNARASLHRGKTIFYQSQQKSWSESKFLNEWKHKVLLQWLIVACPPLHNSIEPRHLTNKSQPRALWANEILLIVEYFIYHIIINTHVDDDVIKKKHDMSRRDTRERSNRCATPRRSSISGAWSWRSFWFDQFFRSMIFGQVMAKIRHGGGSRTVVFRPFWEVVRCGLFGVTNE